MEVCHFHVSSNGDLSSIVTVDVFPSIPFELSRSVVTAPTRGHLERQGLACRCNVPHLAGVAWDGLSSPSRLAGGGALPKVGLLGLHQ